MSHPEAKGVVILHYGPMGIDTMSAATRLAGKDAVIGTDAARMSGASFAVGPAELLDALTARLAPGAITETRARHGDLSDEAVAWLATGERGLSAEAIFTRLTGVIVGHSAEMAHPSDPADLRRCRLLLEQVPELSGRIGEMVGASPEWDRLATRWDEICTTMDAEAPEWREQGGRAERTYAMMKQTTAS